MSKLYTNDVSINILRGNLVYNPISGIFTSKIPRANNKIKIGQVVGNKCCKGYIRFSVGGKRSIVAHRAAWAYMTGEWPTCQVDHIDRNKSNNAFSNLRLCPNNNVENRQNMPPQKNNTSGVSGVHYMKEVGMWRARININNKRISLGVFKTKEEAIKAREDAVAIHYLFAT